MAAEAYRRGAERARQLTPRRRRRVDLEPRREGRPLPRSSISTTPASTCTSSEVIESCSHRLRLRLAERLADLDHGDIPAILTAARALPLASRKARDRDKALHYSTIHRMHYAWYRYDGPRPAPSSRLQHVAGAQAVGMRWTEQEPPESSPALPEASTVDESRKGRRPRRAPVLSDPPDTMAARAAALSASHAYQEN